MSSILVNIPDDGWFETRTCAEPDDKMLCIIVHSYGDRTPGIYQFRKADWLHPDGDYFLDVSEAWRILEYGGHIDDWEPSFAPLNIVDYWKLLGLPAEDNQRIIKKIESWFDENEMTITCKK